MAIINQGRIVLTGEPGALTQQLHGRVWHKTLPKAELEACKQRYQVISTRLKGGETLVHVLSNGCPDPSFAPQEPSLEDLYFATLAETRRQAAAA